MTEIRENGIGKIGEKIMEAVNDNVLVHFKSKENFKELATRVSARFNSIQITENFNNYLERVNDWLFGIHKAN
jgi:sorbitol-specific phosphotransferase system component IIA